MTPRLIVFGGLPGTGKTTLSRQTALTMRAVYLRIDTIEQGLLRSMTDVSDAGGSGYAIACSVAEDNLKAGLDVVADCVNPLPVTREMFRSAARTAAARLIEIEIVCSDRQEHRRRVETRQADIPGHRLPSWAEVQGRDYARWDRPVLSFDTAQRSPGDLVAEILTAIETERAGGR